jgi:hypothetical protein
MIIFDKSYSDESLVDLSEQVMDAICDDSLNLPTDEYGLRKGIFKVVVTWESED